MFVAGSGWSCLSLEHGGLRLVTEWCLKPAFVLGEKSQPGLGTSFHLMEEVTGLTEPWDLLSFAAPPSCVWWERSRLSLPWLVLPTQTLLCFVQNLLLQFHLNIK